jgi:hypothetical protein
MLGLNGLGPFFFFCDLSEGAFDIPMMDGLERKWNEMVCFWFFGFFLLGL